MNKLIKTISPVDGTVYVEKHFATNKAVEEALSIAQKAQLEWKNTPITERAAICLQAVENLEQQGKRIAEELSWQMGRPIRYGEGEVAGFAFRARHMIALAEKKLSTIQIESDEGLTRFIKREPLGAVFSLAPWNYPYLTAVNSVIPAIMAGNAVLLKPSAQTPLTAERIAEAFTATDLPFGVFQTLLLNHQQTANIINSSQIDMVAFTGSVAGGVEIERVAAGNFIDVNLELGGKDPAYVRSDANLETAIESLVDGAFFNSGQSCCAVERIYVHSSVYQDFVDGFVALTKQYVLGHPLDHATTLGPVVNHASAERVQRQIKQAIEMGAEAMIDVALFNYSEEHPLYLPPQVLLNVNHEMDVMRDESFGPVVGIMSVESDEQAVALMNDSEFGLTASVWTEDKTIAMALGEQVNTGTWFMNRCDYLDPSLAWVGVKKSGRGATLSEIGYERLTRAKSFYLKGAVK